MEQKKRTEQNRLIRIGIVGRINVLPLPFFDLDNLGELGRSSPPSLFTGRVWNAGTGAGIEHYGAGYFVRLASLKQDRYNLYFWQPVSQRVSQMGSRSAVHGVSE